MLTIQQKMAFLRDYFLQSDFSSKSSQNLHSIKTMGFLCVFFLILGQDILTQRNMCNLDTLVLP
jgi:hypothetical protein